ncbi:ABC transporter permease [Polycladospora coralii]
MKTWFPVLITSIVFLLLWEAIVILFAIETWLLPSPYDILRETWEIRDRIFENLRSTFTISIFGLMSGLVLGVGIATVLYLIPFLQRIFYPFILISQNIPLIALAPLLVMWFGFGVGPKITIVMLICFFPIVVSTLDGFTQTDPTLQTYLKMAGASRWQRFIKLEWPSALPSFFSGLKLSATYSVMGAVISEWLGSQKGLGVLLTLSSKSFRTDRVFVAITFIVILSICFFIIISWIERFILHWKQNP